MPATSGGLRAQLRSSGAFICFRRAASGAESERHSGIAQKYYIDEEETDE